MNKTRIAATLSFTFFSVFALSAFAQGTDYVMLAPVPGLTKPGSEGLTNTATFLPAFFKMVIGLASALAVVMLLYGGIQYMTTDAWNKKDSAKETIKDALVGLLLTLSAYLIIYTINPKMLSFNLEIPQLEIPRSGLSVGDTDGVGDGETGGGSCTDCVRLSVPGKTAIQGGCSGTGFCQVSSGLNSKLENLHRRISIYVTEAYPPTRQHQNDCHAAGTCVDIRRVSDNQVHNLISAAQLSSLKAVFEVETEARKNAVISASCGRVGAASNCRSTLGEFIAVLPPRDGRRQITEEHFSIYNQ